MNGEAKDGATPLYEACRNDHSDIVEFLLSQSADANRAGKDGLLPLHVAARRGNDRYNANTNTNAAKRSERTGVLDSSVCIHFSRLVQDGV